MVESTETTKVVLVLVDAEEKRIPVICRRRSRSTFEKNEGNVESDNNSGGLSTGSASSDEAMPEPLAPLQRTSHSSGEYEPCNNNSNFINLPGAFRCSNSVLQVNRGGEDGCVHDESERSCGDAIIPIVVEARVVTPDHELEAQLEDAESGRQSAEAKLQSAQAELDKLRSVLSQTVTADTVQIDDGSNNVMESPLKSINQRKQCIIIMLILTAVVLIASSIVAFIIRSLGDDEGAEQELVDDQLETLVNVTSNNNGPVPFTAKEELVDAVQKYLFNKRSNSEVAAMYGWPIGTWDVSRISDFSFVCADIRFNEPIGTWNVSAGTSFASMFEDATSFNQDLSTWDVSKSTNFRGMFYKAQAFNADVGAWNVAKGADFSYMFSSASVFDQNLSSWDVHSGNVFEGMFDKAISFNQNIGSWKLSQARDIRAMFKDAQSFDQNLCAWSDFMKGRQIVLTDTFRGSACPYQNIGGNTDTTSPPQQLCHSCL